MLRTSCVWHQKCNISDEVSVVNEMVYISAPFFLITLIVLININTLSPLLGPAIVKPRLSNYPLRSNDSTATLICWWELADLQIIITPRFLRGRAGLRGALWNNWIGKWDCSHEQEALKRIPLPGALCYLDVESLQNRWLDRSRCH